METFHLIDPVTFYVVGIIFLATLVRSTLGFGEALVAVPLLALRLPVTLAAPLSVMVSVLVAAVITAQDWRHVEVRSAISLILVALLGIPLGLMLLAKGNDHVVKMILGTIIIAFVLYCLIGKTKLHLEKDHWGWLLGCGFFSGVLGGAYGMNGPPLAVYGALRRWSPQHFRATLQVYFLVASLIGLLGYLALGLWQPLLGSYFLASLPAVLVAILLGRVLNRRFNGPGFLRWVYWGLAAVGTALIVQATF